MTNFRNSILYLFLILIFSCGRNEPEVTETDVPETSQPTTAISSEKAIVTEPEIQVAEKIDTIDESSHLEGGSGLEEAIQRQTSKPTISQKKLTQTNQKTTTKQLVDQTQSNTSIPTKKANLTSTSPLRILLKEAKIGKTYSQKELIEKYKFPKEAVDLIKKVTCVGPNQLYFNWGSTWLVEKVSDAEFKNDTLLFKFKQNKTYISGGAIGIKYNKKIHTELILNNGSAYIPTVKGYHWEIGK